MNKTQFLGWNQYKTHPRAYKYYEGELIYTCTHAELAALKQVPKDRYADVKLFVTRLKKGRVTFSKPCDNCMSIITELGVKTKNIYYTDYNGNWVRYRS